MNFLSALLFICLTILVYAAMIRVYKRFPSPILVPIATSTLVMISILLFSHYSYDDYMRGGSWLSTLLGPAVVALAYPLYQHRKTLRSFFVSILTSVLAGTTAGLISGIYLAWWCGLDEKIILSLAPKSVTSPVAMSISSLNGGIPALAAVYVMVAGISGAVFGPILLKKLNITNSIAIGIGLGTASHGIGTSKASEYGELESAISSIAMTLSAIFTSLLCPFFLHFLF
ncbi:putative murein hydrolase (TIGR00659 family) [Peribacillus deserti]|uniref:Murein hydrolase (TIGR00659 family) n=1 Tax=Peribacillus deserti TaxID=673318 RepID=A0ABS2QL16_9BACI|nr:LrgB family protein [Peribacillus deserti]MBM7693864.1 putative murein hydrolase (TIGR00659 family) [Peribacillus deserti]